ncbi:MAG: hypothetical protein ACQXXF_06260 [Thermoplasmatota archaeon]|jgi:hypothetical protein
MKKIISKKSFLKIAITIIIIIPLILPSSSIIANNTQQNNAVKSQIKRYRIIKPLETIPKADNILISN